MRVVHGADRHRPGAVRDRHADPHLPANDSLHISLIDTVAATTGDLFFNSSATLAYARNESWTAMPASANRTSRAALRAAIDGYLDMWSDPHAAAAMPFGDPCERIEGGRYVSACTLGVPKVNATTAATTKPNSMRRYVIDEVLGSADVPLRLHRHRRHTGLPRAAHGKRPHQIRPHHHGCLEVGFLMCFRMSRPGGQCLAPGCRGRSPLNTKNSSVAILLVYVQPARYSNSVYYASTKTSTGKKGPTEHRVGRRPGAGSHRDHTPVRIFYRPYFGPT